MTECVIYADGVKVGKKVAKARVGERFGVRLLVPRKQGVLEARVYLRAEGEETYSMLPMEWQGCENDLDVYTVQFPEKERGLYWFYIEADTYYGTEVAYRKGASMAFATDYNWMSEMQLSVYEREYEVPDFIRGGLFYHIFVDRFCKGKAKTRKDEIKSRYKIRKPGESYNNEKERSIVIRKDWGGEPIWEPDENGEILSNDFFGGNLEGIIEKLDYFESLGVTCLYLSPIFEAYSNHKYDTGDYLKIDSMFGDEATFEKLCKLAKKKGISIILDGVFNHTGSDSRYFNQYGTYTDEKGAYQSKRSKYRQWYDFAQEGHWRSWWGIQTLPTVNKDAESYRKLLFGKDGVIRKWLRLGAAGWRLDVVDELPDEFVRELVKAAKAEKKDALILGEVWEDASNKIAYGKRREYFLGNELDSVMNYPWKDAIIEYMRSADATHLADKVDSIMNHYPTEVLSCMMNTLGTHDSARILTALVSPEVEDMSREKQSYLKMDEGEYHYAIRLLKMAVILEMTLPGVPCIYYADEAGMEGGKDPFNRKCYQWEKVNDGLLEFYRKFGMLRRTNRTFFADSDFEIINGPEELFGFVRTLGEDALVVVENRSAKRFTTTVSDAWKPLFTEDVSSEAERILPAVFTEETVGDGIQNVALEPYYGVLVAKGPASLWEEWK